MVEFRDVLSDILFTHGVIVKPVEIGVERNQDLLVEK